MAAIITQVADRYYILEIDGREEIGSVSRTRLVQYAKAQGVTHLHFRDARKPRLRVTSWHPTKGEI